jgi:hypothetical protein
MSVERISETVFTAPGFEVVAKSIPAGDDDLRHYALRLDDYVCAVAVTPRHELVLVRQRRLAVERMTLELPAATWSLAPVANSKKRPGSSHRTGSCWARWRRTPHDCPTGFGVTWRSQRSRVQPSGLSP